ncbi:MAG: tetratricopeptide repeat protein [Elusimicrobiota bacterium]|jgi:tetratricopeptide (TPR) repeat protein
MARPKTLPLATARVEPALGGQAAVDENRYRLWKDMTQVRALVRERRLEAAFALCEGILDGDPDAEIIEALMCPLDADARELPPGLMYDLLTALKTKPRPRSMKPWADLMRVNLLERLTRTEDAFLATEALGKLPGRYGWMRILRGIMLTRIRFAYKDAEAEFRPVLKTSPRFWKTKAYIAEAALCQGEAARALKTMDGLISDLKGYEAAAALGWKGELRLWCGDYAGALKDLTESLRGGAHMSMCWRAACLYKLGKPDAALSELDAYLKKWDCDQEGLIWRGEIKRRQGRHKEALQDLDAAVRLRNSPLWAHINRALVHAALKDHDAMWADYYVLPVQVVSFFQWKCKIDIETDRSPEKVRRLLEAILDAGKGLRRNDCYLYPVWMDRP